MWIKSFVVELPRWIALGAGSIALGSIVMMMGAYAGVALRLLDEVPMALIHMGIAMTLGGLATFALAVIVYEHIPPHLRGPRGPRRRDEGGEPWRARLLARLD